MTRTVIHGRAVAGITATGRVMFTSECGRSMNTTVQVQDPPAVKAAQIAEQFTAWLKSNSKALESARWLKLASIAEEVIRNGV